MRAKPTRRRPAARPVQDTSNRTTWQRPSWLTDDLVALIGNTGGWITPEHAMNCRGDRDGCDLAVNGPRALLCLAVSSQVRLLERLHAKGEL